MAQPFLTAEHRPAQKFKKTRRSGGHWFWPGADLVKKFSALTYATLI